MMLELTPPFPYLPSLPMSLTLPFVSAGCGSSDTRGDTCGDTRGDTRGDSSVDAPGANF